MREALGSIELTVYRARSARTRLLSDRSTLSIALPNAVTSTIWLRCCIEYAGSGPSTGDRDCSVSPTTRHRPSVCRSRTGPPNAAFEPAIDTHQPGNGADPAPCSRFPR